MIFSLLHFLTGYCQVALSGAGQERFLNICVSKQLLIWKLIRKENHYIFYVSRAGWKELEEIAAKTGCSYQCLSKKGAPYLFYRYKKRKCLLFAFLLSIGFLYFLSLFLWQIQTEGCYSHSKEEILDYLEAQGVKSGTKISKISCSGLEEQMRRDYKDIAWVSCELKGTLLKVTIKETLDTAAVKEETEDTPCNLIASKSGTIESIVVRSGSAKVKKGDAVKEGDVLISGVVELYDDGGQLTETSLVKAEGDIFAVTKEAYSDTFPLLHYEKKYTGKSQKQYQVLIGNQLLKLPDKKIGYKNYDENVKQKILHIGPQLYLPCSLFVTTISECQILEKTYTKKEAEAEAKKRLSVFLEEYETKGVEILKNNVTINCNENECTAKGSIMLKERFGKIQELDEAVEEGAKE